MIMEFNVAAGITHNCLRIGFTNGNSVQHDI